MRNDLASIALRAVVGVMGERDPIPYTRGEQTVLVKGVFQRDHWSTDEGTGVRVNSTQPVLLVNRLDLPFAPRQGDVVEVAEQIFQVRDPQPDGHQGWLLLLHRISTGGVFVDDVFDKEVFA